MVEEKLEAPIGRIPTGQTGNADLKNYTVEELYEERRLLLEVQTKMEAFRKSGEPRLIQAAAGSVEEVRNDGLR
jgi:hypothetical protein